jgi:hypothetical protein
LVFTDLIRLSFFTSHYSSTSGEWTYSIEEILSQLAAAGAIFLRPSEVRGYLLRYPEMVSLTFGVANAVLDRFAGTAELSLEVYRDPEIGDEYLTLFVRQRKYDEDIIEKIDQLSAEYQVAFHRTAGWLLLTTDFRDPMYPSTR